MDSVPTPPPDHQESHATDTLLTTPQDPDRLRWVERLALTSIREHAAAIAGLNE